ncbi:uncharacterized protein VNE69_10104 [Vairimorpha necatrix]|uniref:Membrane protein n=1 Tax=Vairimorpha necatrix TaxID=6039 RepID=A0AAX4JG42_9MICR
MESKTFAIREIYTVKPPAIVSEINELSVNYSTYLDSSFYISTAILISGIYLSLLGIYTVRCSLAFIMSIFIFHYFEQILHNGSTIGPLNRLVSGLNHLTKYSEYPYIPIILISLLLSTLTVYLLSGFRLIIGLVATYIFYSTYIESIITINNETQRYVFYASIVIVFCLVYLLFSKALNLIFCLLFSVTGTLIVFMSIEKVFSFDFDLRSIFLVLRNDWEQCNPSFISMTWILSTGLGLCIQVFFMSKYSVF